jgi:hypothetical protein
MKIQERTRPQDFHVKKQCCGSGSGSVRIRNFWPDPDPIRIRNKSVKRSLIFRPKKDNFRQLWNISSFSRKNLITISIFATQLISTGNSLTNNRIIGIHCPVTFCAVVNFDTRLRSTAARWLISRTHDSKKPCENTCGLGKSAA